MTKLYKSILPFFLLSFPAVVLAQSPLQSDESSSVTFLRDINEWSDTITFSQYAPLTAISNQYVSNGVLFSGFNGSTNPLIENYPDSYGLILHSSDWYSGIKIQFVEPLNAAVNKLAKRIEFDNPIDSTETDYVHVNAYDINDNLIRHYMSVSPEHVVMEFDEPMVSYITVDDSAETAYVIDNILVDAYPIISTGIARNPADVLNIYPNPSTGAVQITGSETIDELIVTTITGQQVFHAFPESSTSGLSINTPGIYLVSIRSGERFRTGKLVICQ